MDVSPLSFPRIVLLAGLLTGAIDSAQGAPTLDEAATVASSGGATHWVANNGTDSSNCGSRAKPCRSISQAIENAVDGDTIWVGAGRYGNISGDVSFTGPGDEHPSPQGPYEFSDTYLREGCMICVTKALHIYSFHGASTTIIEANPAAPIGVSVAILHDGVDFGAPGRGFTITGGNRVGLAVAIRKFRDASRKNVSVVGNVDVKDGIGFGWIGQYLTPQQMNGCPPDLCFRYNQILFSQNQAIDNDTGFSMQSSTDNGPGPVIVRDNFATGASTGFAVEGEGTYGFRVLGNPAVKLLDNVAVHSGKGFSMYAPGAADGNTASGNKFGFYLIPVGMTFQRNSAIGNAGPGVIVDLSPDPYDYNGGFASFTRNNFFGNDRNRPSLIVGGVFLQATWDTGPSAHCGVLNVGPLGALPGSPGEISPIPATTLPAAGNFWGSPNGPSATGPGDAAGGPCNQNRSVTIAKPFAVTSFDVQSWP